jgi:flavin reductase (DIM6/NTAB) family NADH-FMN oxidoreductase RutF
MPMDDARFKEALSHFPSGVTILTTEHEGTRYGMTVASFASLSLHPPLVLVCVARSAKSHDAIHAAGHFGVSILEQSQAELSGRFASKADDKFSGVATRRGEHGMPLIDAALCTMECRVHDEFASGDHTIFVGEVLDSSTSDGAPLVYFRSSYREIT